ncbi:MAG: hypothetical protein ACK4RK_09855 [Gemmataceae bacterium]
MLRWGGLALLMVMGCTLPEYLRLNYHQSQYGDGSDRQVFGRLEVVANSTSNVLQRLGVSVVSQEGVDDVRLICQTKKGKRFVLILSRVQQPHGEYTHIHIEWEDKKADPVGVLILTQIAQLHGS